ncbi:hypothetical protein D9M72_472610 [compost metagenome]
MPLLTVRLVPVVTIIVKPEFTVRLFVVKEPLVLVEKFPFMIASTLAVGAPYDQEVPFHVVEVGAVIVKAVTAVEKLLQVLLIFTSMVPLLVISEARIGAVN